MSDFGLFMILKPFGLLVFFLLLAVLVRMPVQRFMPNGKLKTLLLSDVSGDSNARRWREWRSARKQVQ